MRPVRGEAAPSDSGAVRKNAAPRPRRVSACPMVFRAAHWESLNPFEAKGPNRWHGDCNVPVGRGISGPSPDYQARISRDFRCGSASLGNRHRPEDADARGASGPRSHPTSSGSAGAPVRAGYRSRTFRSPAGPPQPGLAAVRRVRP